MQSNNKYQKFYKVFDEINLKEEDIIKLKESTDLEELYIQSEYFTDTFISYEDDGIMTYPYCCCCKQNYITK